MPLGDALPHPHRARHLRYAPRGVEEGLGRRSAEETGTKFETEKELKFRSSVMEQNQPEDVAAVCAMKVLLQEGKIVDGGVYQKLLPLLCFLVGATGLSSAIAQAFSRKNIDIAAMHSICSLTEVRHLALEMNEKFSYVPSI